MSDAAYYICGVVVALWLGGAGATFLYILYKLEQEND